MASSRLSVEDRLDILDLMVRADNAATARDADAYAALFTPDAVLDGAEGEHGGGDMRGSVGTIWRAEGEKSAHLTLNAVIEPVDGRVDRATARSTLVIVAFGAAPDVRTVVPILQHVVKVGDHWLC